MLTYFVHGPFADGQFHVVYPTPGAPHVLTTAGSASSKEVAERECTRLNEAKVVDKREAIVRKANMIVRDIEAGKSTQS